MRLLISLVSFLLTLVGCDPRDATTTLTLSSVDGIHVNSSKARIAEANARFECLQSASGRCYYVVFTSDCAPADAKVGTAASACSVRSLQAFILSTGEKREFTDLPAGARHCVGHEAMPVAPDCRKS